MGAPVGPATLVSWVFVGLLTFTLVKEDQLPVLHPATTSTSVPLLGAWVPGGTTTSTESSTTPRLRGPELVVRFGTASDQCTFSLVASIFGWLVTALGGVAVGRWSRRTSPSAPLDQARPTEVKPRAPLSSATVVSSPSRNRVAAPSKGALGCVVIPSTRRSREANHGKVA